MGPSFEFKDFIKFIYLEKPYDDIPFGLTSLTAVLEMGKAFLCMLFYVSLIGKFDPLYVTSPEFGNKSLFYKVNKIFLILVCICKHFNACSEDEILHRLENVTIWGNLYWTCI